MKTILTNTFILAMGLGASLVVATPLPTSTCLDVAAFTREVDTGVHEVTASFAWRCDPRILGQAAARMTVNGVPAGGTALLSGSDRQVLKAHVFGQRMPMKVCVTVQAMDENQVPTVTATQCDLVDELFVPLPHPTLPSELRRLGAIEPAS